MGSKGRWLAVSLVVGLAVVACQDDGGSDDADEATPAATVAATAAPADPTEAPADPTAAPAAEGAGAAGSMTLGDEVIALASARCFFEEQPRAGLGGVFTHTAQGSGTNAAGDAVLLDVSRARDEDGTEGDDVTVDIGDFTSDDAISLRVTGEGIVDFGDASASADGLELQDFSEFDSEPVALSFEMSC